MPVIRHTISIGISRLSKIVSGLGVARIPSLQRSCDGHAAMQRRAHPHVLLRDTRPQRHSTPTNGRHMVVAARRRAGTKLTPALLFDGSASAAAAMRPQTLPGDELLHTYREGGAHPPGTCSILGMLIMYSNMAAGRTFSRVRLQRNSLEDSIYYNLLELPT